jgi:hypothetical protein
LAVVDDATGLEDLQDRKPVLACDVSMLAATRPHPCRKSLGGTARWKRNMSTLLTGIVYLRQTRHSRSKRLFPSKRRSSSNQSVANRQRRGPSPSLVTTASCLVKEGALTIRFSGPDLRPQASKINSWRFQHGPSPGYR